VTYVFGDVGAQLARYGHQVRHVGDGPRDGGAVKDVAEADEVACDELVRFMMIGVLLMWGSKSVYCVLCLCLRVVL
jgi:hypothetical protein